MFRLFPTSILPWYKAFSILHYFLALLSTMGLHRCFLLMLKRSIIILFIISHDFKLVQSLKLRLEPNWKIFFVKEMPGSKTKIFCQKQTLILFLDNHSWSREGWAIYVQKLKLKTQLDALK